MTREFGKLNEWPWFSGRHTPGVWSLVEVSSKEGVEYLVEIPYEMGPTDDRACHVDRQGRVTSMDVALNSKMEPDLVGGPPIRTFFLERDDPIWRHRYRVVRRSGPRISKCPLCR